MKLQHSAKHYQAQTPPALRPTAEERQSIASKKSFGATRRFNHILVHIGAVLLTHGYVALEKVKH